MENLKAKQEANRLNYKGDFTDAKVIFPREFGLDYFNGMFDKVNKDGNVTKEDPLGEFNFGDRVQFVSGYNDDILYESVIFGFEKEDAKGRNRGKKGMLYVYADSYWFPIERKAIKID